MLRLVSALVILLAALPVAAADAPFDYFENSWSVIGLKDYQHGTRLTPDNQLLLAGERKVRFSFGRDLVPLSREQVKVNAEGWLPIIQLTAHDGPVRYDFEFFASPLPTIADWKAAYNWPIAGEDFANWIIVNMTNTGSTAAKARLRMDFIEEDEVQGRTQEWELKPGDAHRKWVSFVTTFELVNDLAKYTQKMGTGNDAELWRERTVQFWKSVVLKGTHISVPCTKSTEALLASHVCQLIANDHGEVHGGEGFYDRFYIRDGAFQVMELQEAGLMESANLAVKRYLDHQRPDGRFESQENQFDANGQALWVLWQHYKMTRDKEWLAKVYPQMRRAVDWMMAARRQAPADSPFAGVLPNAVADGEFLWDGKHHIVGYDLWNLRGMLCTADAARILGRSQESAELLAEAEDYRKAIDAAHRRTGLAHFPPSWELKGTHWGNTETLWPTELFARDDQRVTALIEEVRERHGGGFHEGTIRWLGKPDAIHPYMSAYTTMACLIRGEHEQVVEDYYWYLLHSTATHAFPEGIFYKRRFAWADTIPHVTGACNFAIMLRHMLIHEAARLPAEDEGELHLLLAVPDWWLQDGCEILVERAPTHFGSVGLLVKGEKAGVRIELAKPADQPPARIVLHLPKSRPLLNSLDGVEVVYRADQNERWDFQKVVGIYRREAGK